MKRMFVLAILTMFMLACVIPGLSTTQNPAPPAAAATSADTQGQMATYVAQTVVAQQPAATQAPVATQAPQATTTSHATQSTSSAIMANQNWSGTFLWNGYSNAVNLIIQKITGSSFTGAQAWSATQCRVTERVQGDIVQDVTTATEQNRWALHPDFKSGDKSGTWLRWTETENIGTGRCYLTISGDWYYAHVKNGHLIAIHFTNTTNTENDRNAAMDLTLYLP